MEFCQPFFVKKEKNFIKTIRIIKETIIDGPEGIFRIYEKYNPSRIPIKEKNTDKNTIL